MGEGIARMASRGAHRHHLHPDRLAAVHSQRGRDLLREVAPMHSVLGRLELKRHGRVRRAACMHRRAISRGEEEGDARQRSNAPAHACCWSRSCVERRRKRQRI